MTDEHARRTTHEVEHKFYLYDSEDDDPRYSFWVSKPGEGEVALYDRPPEGHGMWLGTEEDSDYGSVPPSEDLEIAISGLMGEGIPSEQLMALEGHEKHFAQIVVGTVDENVDGIPGAVWSWMHDCAEKHDIEVRTDA